MGNCAQGPNITINGNEYHEVSSDILPEILKKELIEI